MSPVEHRSSYKYEYVQDAVHVTHGWFGMHVHSSYIEGNHTVNNRGPTTWSFEHIMCRDNITDW